MLAVKELRDELAALRVEKTKALDAIEARDTTTEVLVEKLRHVIDELTVQVPAIDSNVGSIIESVSALRSDLSTLDTTVINAKIALNDRFQSGIEDWRLSINKRSYIGAAFLAAAVALSEIVRYFV